MSLQEAARQEAFDRYASMSNGTPLSQSIYALSVDRYVHGAEFGAAWAEQEAAALLEAARAYRDAAAAHASDHTGSGWDRYMGALTELREAARTFEAGEGQED